MNRRTFLGSLTVLTGASASVFGTGAFSTASVSREVTIAVSPDDEALLALQPTRSGGTVRSEDGVLSINTGAGDADGVNPSSLYTFGSWDQTGEVTDPILQIRNQSRVRQKVEFTYEWDPVATGESELVWYFTWESDGITHTDQIVVSDTNDEATIVASDIPVGQAIGVAFGIDAADPGDELSGDIKLKSSDPNV